MAREGQAKQTSPTYRFELSGGALCLDFANTVGDRPRGEQEHLERYGDLLRWAAQAEVLDQAEFRRLARRARSHPDEAEQAFAQATKTRERLYRIFSAIAAGGRPRHRDLAALNQEVARVFPRREIVEAGEGFAWSWSGSADAFDRPLWPVLRSAVDLLTSEEFARVRECASPTCSWLFVDRSPSRRRRWCDMKTCGNRAKARRHYQRVKLKRQAQTR